MDAHDEPVMLYRYAAWLSADGSLSRDSRREFYVDGIVVLDTNVLLSLYEFKQAARDDVFRALEKLGDRLWLPHQVGLEFVRRRHKVVVERNSALKNSKSEIDRRITEIRRSAEKASKYVEDLLTKYADDQSSAADLRAMVAEKIDALADELKPKMQAYVKTLQDNEISQVLGSASDPVLERVAKLYGRRVAESPSLEEIRQRVESAARFRFPNQIPPGFADRKGSPLADAGDLLIWEEVIDMASSAGGEPCRVLFVSNDEKDDWYEMSGPGLSRNRPWPWLHDELRQRAGAHLCIETTKSFFDGVKEFLGADLGVDTLEEIDRASQKSPLTVTVDNALVFRPPEDLVRAAFECLNLSSALQLVSGGAGSRVYAVFAWWLIGVTAELGKRAQSESEPFVEINALRRSEVPPGEGWWDATGSPLGHWPDRSIWIAEWFTAVQELVSISEARLLRNIAVRQLGA